MAAPDPYNVRLAELVQKELDSRSISRRRLADSMNVAPQTLANWLNPATLKGRPATSTLLNVARYLQCDIEALLRFLEAGEWPSDQDVVTADRVTSIERRLDALEKRLPPKDGQTYRAASPPTSYGLVDTSGRLLRMTVLGVAIQKAFQAAGQTWQDHAVILEAHGLLHRPVEEGGLGFGYTPETLTVQRFQKVVWGLVLPVKQEHPQIAQILRVFTGDGKWTAAYVAGLCESNGLPEKGRTYSQ